MSDSKDSTERRSHFFADVLGSNSLDSEGITFRSGLIKFCREWRTHRNVEAFELYARLLYQDANNAESYDELCNLVLSDFIGCKAATLRSLFPSLTDIAYLTSAAKARNDFHNYAISLATNSVVWETAIAQLKSGVPATGMDDRQVHQLVEDTKGLRSPLEAFDLLVKALNAVRVDKANVLGDMADALLECVQEMDNEGTRAHHVHRALYAVRLKNEKLALTLVPHCRRIAAGITDEFQRLVCNLFLVQQVAPMDMDEAGEIAREVNGASFVYETAETMMALAAIGRNREPSELRIERLESLIKRAQGLERLNVRLSTVTELSLEIFWEHPRIETLRRVVSILESSVKELPDKQISEALENVLCPEPIKINHATSPYRDGTEGLGTAEARNLGNAIGLLSGAEDELFTILSRIVDLFAARIVEVSDDDDQNDLTKKLIVAFRKIAVNEGPDLGARVLKHLETVVERQTDEIEALINLASIAASWYQLALPQHAQPLIVLCVTYVEECRDQIARVLKSNSESAKDSDRPFGRLLRLLELMSESTQRLRKKLAGKYQETDAEIFQKHKGWVIHGLADAFGEIPAKYRREAFAFIQPILEYGREDTSISPEEEIARALAKTDMTLVRLIIENIEGERDRSQVAIAAAESIGEEDPKAALALLDSEGQRKASAKVAKHIRDTCFKLLPFQTPKKIWSGISDLLAQLTQSSYRTSASYLCTLKIAEQSTADGMAIAERELDSLSGPENTESGPLKALRSFLGILEGRRPDFETLLAECRGKVFGERTRKLVRERVSPFLSVSQPEQAVDLLLAIGEFKEGFSGLSDTILVLLNRGERAAAKSIISCLPKVLSSLSKEPGEEAVLDFLEQVARTNDIPCLSLSIDVIARHEARYRREELIAGIAQRICDSQGTNGTWQWLTEQSQTFGDSKLRQAVDLCYVVFSAASEPRAALLHWLKSHKSKQSVAARLIRRAMTADSAATIEIIKDMQDGRPKALALFEAYSWFHDHPSVVAIPSPERLLKYLKTPGERGELCGNYIAVGEDLDDKSVLSLIANLDHPEERCYPVEVAFERLGVRCQDSLLEIIKRSVEQLSEEHLDEYDLHRSLHEWARVAAALSLDVGVAILKRIGDSFDRVSAAESIFQYCKEITPELVINLAEGFDEYDTARIIRKAAEHLWPIDPAKAELLVSSLSGHLDDDEQRKCLESAKEKSFKEEIVRDPGGAFVAIKLINNQSDQAERLQETLDLLGDKAEVSITRWECVLEIIEAWVRSMETGTYGDDDDLISEIAKHAPSLAYEKYRVIKLDERKANVGRGLLDVICKPEHAHLLNAVVEGYRHQFEKSRTEDEALLIVDCSACLSRLKEKLAEWDSGTVEAVSPMLIEFLEEFPGRRAHRDVVILELLRRMSVFHTDKIKRLLAMIDTPDAMNRASSILSEQLEADQLQELADFVLHSLSPSRTAEGEAVRILSRVLQSVSGIALGSPSYGAPPEFPDARETQAFSLIAGSYPTLCGMAPGDRPLLLTEIFKLLHRIVKPARLGDVFLSMSFDRQGFEDVAAMDPPEAGKAVASLLSSLAILPEHIALREARKAVDLTTQGEPSESLPPLVGDRPARLCTNSDGSLFMAEFLANLKFYPDDIQVLVKRCLAAFEKSCNRIDYTGDLLHIVESLRTARADLRKHYAKEAMRLSEKLAGVSETFKDAVPILRVFLATELLVPDSFPECVQWLRAGVRELIDHTGANEMTRELFQSLARIGCCFGRIVVMKECGPDLPSRIEPWARHILISLAELESQGSKKSKKAMKSAVLKVCSEIEKDLLILEELCNGLPAPPPPSDLEERQHALVEKLFRLLKRSATQSPMEKNRADDAENDADDDAREISEATEDLSGFSGCFWKIGLEKLGAKRDEIITLICELASKANVEELGEENSIVEVNLRFGLELFVRCLAKDNREEALKFIKAVSEGKEKTYDLGLFEALLLEEPGWVFTQIEAIGSEDEVAERLEALINRLALAAPTKLQEVEGFIESFVHRHEGWVFRANVLEALKLALVSIDKSETPSLAYDMPEFWGRSQVVARLARTVWKQDPFKALAMVDEIDISQVKCETLVHCAKTISSNGEQPFRIVEGILAQCGSLPEAEQRFTVGREVLFALSGLHARVEPEKTLEMVYQFLELFTSAPIDWLRLAYLHCVPILSHFLEKDAIAELGRGILSANNILMRVPRVDFRPDLSVKFAWTWS